MSGSRAPYAVITLIAAPVAGLALALVLVELTGSYDLPVAAAVIVTAVVTWLAWSRWTDAGVAALVATVAGGLTFLLSFMLLSGVG